MAQYITIERLRKLDESLGYLNEFTNITDVRIGKSLEDVDVEKTALLKELAALNVRRFEVIRDLLK